MIARDPHVNRIHHYLPPHPEPSPWPARIRVIVSVASLVTSVFALVTTIGTNVAENQGHAWVQCLNTAVADGEPLSTCGSQPKGPWWLVWRWV